MITYVLQLYLGYLTYVRPVLYGAQLCREARPDAVQVTNTVLALVFGWLMEVADGLLLLPSLFAVRWLYVLARIVFALYLSHPTFLGATTLYERYCATWVDAYLPLVERLLVEHMHTLRVSGGMQMVASLALAYVRTVCGLCEMAGQLLTVASSTQVQTAALPRRATPARHDVDDDVRVQDATTATTTVHSPLSW